MLFVNSNILVKCSIISSNLPPWNQQQLIIHAQIPPLPATRSHGCLYKYARWVGHFCRFQHGCGHSEPGSVIFYYGFWIDIQHFRQVSFGHS